MGGHGQAQGILSGRGSSSGRPPLHPGVGGDDNVLNVSGTDKYVLLAAQSADNAKIVYRNELKNDQRRRELDARERGEPLSARDKERERSRRESSVTRRRAEVYVAQLENTARRLPGLELENADLRREISALHAALAAQNAGHGQSSEHEMHQSQHHQRESLRIQQLQQHGGVGGVELRDGSGNTGATGDEGLMVESGGIGHGQGESGGLVKDDDDVNVVGGSPANRRGGKMGSVLRPVDM